MMSPSNYCKISHFKLFSKCICKYGMYNHIDINKNIRHTKAQPHIACQTKHMNSITPIRFNEPPNRVINSIAYLKGVAEGNVIIILAVVAATFCLAVNECRVSLKPLSLPSSIGNTFTHLRLGENLQNERHC